MGQEVGAPLTDGKLILYPVGCVCASRHTPVCTFEMLVPPVLCLLTYTPSMGILPIILSAVGGRHWGNLAGVTRSQA